MNKTISITIAGLVFNIDEDAYERLKTYLESIQAHFADLAYGAEVVADIETRIAEQFTKKLNETKTQVITRPDVDLLIKTMGTIEDFDPVETKAAHTQATAKRLYRNPDDMMIAGVASGLAAYFGWDTNLVRILFAISVFLGGWGIFIYIFLWVVMPEAKSAAEKLEMRGTPVTLSRLEKTVKETLDGKGKIAKQSLSKTGGLLRHLFQLIIKTVGILFSVAARVGGAVLTTAGMIILAAITFFLVIFLFNPQSPYVDPSIYEIFNGLKYFLILASTYLLIAVPAAILILLGIIFARFKFKDSFKPRVLGTLGALWVIGALTFSALTVQAMPRIEARLNAPVGPSITKTFDFAGFDQIEVHGNFNVTITPQPDFGIITTGPEASFEEMRIAVEDKKLIIDRNERFRICIFCNRDEIKVDISMPTLISAQGYGSSEINAQGFSADKFNLDLNGSSRANMNLVVKDLTIKVTSSSRAELAGTTDNLSITTSSSGRITNNMLVKENLSVVATSSSRFTSVSSLNLKNLNLQTSSGGRVEATVEAERTEIVVSSSAAVTLMGKTKDLTAKLSSSGRLDAPEFEIQIADVTASSSARAMINVINSLKARASSSGRINYTGSPTTDINESSSGRVDQIN